MLTPPQSDLAGVVARLTEAQRRWFDRGFIRIGNPERLVPRSHPETPSRTLAALRMKGILEHTRFGDALTPLGQRCRQLILSAQSRTEGGPET